MHACATPPLFRAAPPRRPPCAGERTGAHACSRCTTVTNPSRDEGLKSCCWRERITKGPRSWCIQHSRRREDPHMLRGVASLCLLATALAAAADRAGPAGFNSKPRAHHCMRAGLVIESLSPSLWGSSPRAGPPVVYTQYNAECSVAADIFTVVVVRLSSCLAQPGPFTQGLSSATARANSCLVVYFLWSGRSGME